jgi:hypothetical protein
MDENNPNLFASGDFQFDSVIDIAPLHEPEQVPGVGTIVVVVMP